jgi:hypothetical protein
MKIINEIKKELLNTYEDLFSFFIHNQNNILLYLQFHLFKNFSFHKKNLGLEQGIRDNNVKVVKMILNSEQFFINNEEEELLFNNFNLAIIRGHDEVVELLSNHKKINISYLRNHVLRFVINSNAIDLSTVKKLIKNPRIDPSTYNNNVIINAYMNKKINIVDLLWEDVRVKNTLKYSHAPLYNLLIKDDVKEKVKGF